MPVLSHGAAARSFLASAAACCLLLLLLKRVAQPWTLKGGVKPPQGKPSSVIKRAYKQLSVKLHPDKNAHHKEKAEGRGVCDSFGGCRGGDPSPPPPG